MGFVERTQLHGLRWYMPAIDRWLDGKRGRDSNPE
jgi:hypothetical protein